MEYFNRIADIQLKERLEAFGAVLIEGPKWCGKTTTAEQAAASVIKLQDTTKRGEYLTTASVNPSLLLRGETPRLIDEWQDAPILWDAVRTTVDERRQVGQFILTGSNTVDKSQIAHSGNGRISRMEMLPMSLWESHESNGAISLKDLFDNPTMDIEAVSEVDIEQIIYIACRGGWPATLQLQSDKSKLLVAKNYFLTVCKEDINRVDGVLRNEKTARMILRSYARNISTFASKKTIYADVIGSENIECSRDTFFSYIKVLEKLFVIQDIDAWCPAVRSRDAIRSTPKRSFCDPSIAVAALQMSPTALMNQLMTFGFLFEQLCIRDLRAYTSDIDTHVGYYHDRYGLEADVVLHLNDGRYALIECKLGSNEIDDGAAHLTELKRLIVEHNKKEKQNPIREPDLLMIITGGVYAYRRPDGVYVVPLACLKD
ncbi:MAG: ATP-binding protein [Bacteroidaceae bacterium]|nr:ATP-binding protein [Bacteroidaceae bacterium]